MNQILPALKSRLLIHPTLGYLLAVYDLRVTVWATNYLFNISRFPTDLFDEFNERSRHWVESHEGYIAAAHLTIGSQLGELPDHNVFGQTQLPTFTTVAMLSRLIVALAWLNLTN